MGKIVLFSTTGCVFCMKAKAALSKYDITYYEVNLSEHPSLWMQMINLTNGNKSVPQIFFNSRYIGGCEELLELEKGGELAFEAQKTYLEDEKGMWAWLPSSLLPSDQSPPPSPSTPYVSKEIEMIYERLRDKTTGLALRTRFVGFRPTTNTFLGEEMIEWMKKEMEIPESSAMRIAQQMMDYQFFLCVSIESSKQSPPSPPHSSSSSSSSPISSSIQSLQKQTIFEKKEVYKFNEDIVGTLNSILCWSGEVRPALEVVSYMQTLLSDIEHQFFNGKNVHYHLIAQSPLFSSYLYCAMELQKINLDELPDTHLMAFFINTYNMLMIHGVIKFGTPSSASDRRSFFNNVSYLIAGHKFSLNDIEHGVLRGNRRAPGTLFRPFNKTDERLKYAVRIFDPRIHFVLVCGAKSCPPIKIYSGDNLDMALQLAAESFCQTEVTICDQTYTVKLSQIFEWYASDFGKDMNGVLTFVCGFVDRENQLKLLEMLNTSEKTGKKITVAYNEYNWAPNILFETFEDFVETFETLNETYEEFTNDSAEELY